MCYTIVKYDDLNRQLTFLNIQKVQRLQEGECTMKDKGVKRICLIGLGLITQKYIKGLEAAADLELCGVSDLNENAVSRPFYDAYPFYEDYKQMLREVKPDYVIISTPPESHYKIASCCLRSGVNVLVEKPVALCMEDFDALTQLAQDNCLVFRTLFHWHGGVETLAFGEKYDLSRIREIRVNISDPYCDDPEIINPDRRPLMGAWIDSGVNALSMIRLWLPFEQVELIGTEVQRCRQTQLPVYGKAELLIDGVKTQIVIDWRRGVDHKESFVKLDDRWVHIDHSGQFIDDEGITNYGCMPRMEQHYKQLFENLAYESNVEFSRSVHQVLFKVGEDL